MLHHCNLLNVWADSKQHTYLVIVQIEHVKLLQYIQIFNFLDPESKYYELKSSMATRQLQHLLTYSYQALIPGAI